MNEENEKKEQAKHINALKQLEELQKKLTVCSRFGKGTESMFLALKPKNEDDKVTSFNVDRVLNPALRDAKQATFTESEAQR